MERTKLYNALPLPNQSIDFYEDILDGKEENAVGWYGTLFLYHSLILVIALVGAIVLYQFVEGMGWHEIQFVAQYVGGTILMLLVIYAVLIFVGAESFYYKYYTFNPFYETYSPDLLLSGMIYKQYRGYFVDDKTPTIFNVNMKLFRRRNTKAAKFIYSNTEDKGKFMRYNTTQYLHETANYYSSDYSGINKEFIQPELIKQIPDKYLADMCEQLNRTYINRGEKTAMFLARHVIEVMIKDIFKNDPEFRETYYTEYKAERNTTLGKMINVFRDRLDEKYFQYLNGEIDNPQRFTQDIHSLNDNLNSCIHGDGEFYDVITDPDKFSKDYQRILRVLIKIRTEIEKEA